MATIPLQQAIEQAKANPTSDFAKQMRQAIESGKLDEAAQKQGVDLSRFGRQVKQPNYLERLNEQYGKASERIKSGIEKGAEDIQSGNSLGALRSGLRTVGSIAGAAVAPIIEAPGVKQVVEGAVGAVAKIPGADALIQKGMELSKKYPEAAKDFEDIINLATLGIGGAIEKPVQSVVSDVAKKTASTIGSTKAVVPKTKDAFLSFVSPEIDDIAKNTLKKTTPEKFDEYVSIAEKASQNADAPSVYEKVSGTLEDATLQLDTQVKSLSQQKKDIINKAKTGLTEFSKETGQTMLDISKSLKDSNLAKSFISRLKTVKTKLDADNAIDELQDILYRGNKDLTIPTGSKEDRVLKAILGKYNTTLKSSLPKSYSKLNDEISSRLSVLETLNQSLGQVVDGVPIRGAGLVKQYFSPAGTKTKQLFNYIKQKTGVDVGQEAILAKYIGEAFGDAKVRSLLEGVPTSTSGIIGKAVDFAIEKIGGNKVIAETKKKGMIQKARDIIKETGGQGGYIANPFSITKKLDVRDMDIMNEFVNAKFAGMGKLTAELKNKAQNLADQMGIEATGTDLDLAKKFSEILDINRESLKKKLLKKK